MTAGLTFINGYKNEHSAVLVYSVDKNGSDVTEIELDAELQGKPPVKLKLSYRLKFSSTDHRSRVHEILKKHLNERRDYHNPHYLSGEIKGDAAHKLNLLTALHEAIGLSEQAQTTLRNIICGMYPEGLPLDWAEQ